MTNKPNPIHKNHSYSETTNSLNQAEEIMKSSSKSPMSLGFVIGLLIQVSALGMNRMISSFLKSDALETYGANALVALFFSYSILSLLFFFLMIRHVHSYLAAATAAAAAASASLKIAREEHDQQKDASVRQMEYSLFNGALWGLCGSGTMLEYATKGNQCSMYLPVLVIGSLLVRCYYFRWHEPNPSSSNKNDDKTTLLTDSLDSPIIMIV